jgi:hypothetical protein
VNPEVIDLAMMAKSLDPGMTERTNIVADKVKKISVVIISVFSVFSEGKMKFDFLLIITFFQPHSNLSFIVKDPRRTGFWIINFPPIVSC